MFLFTHIVEYTLTGYSYRITLIYKCEQKNILFSPPLHKPMSLFLNVILLISLSAGSMISSASPATAPTKNVAMKQPQSTLAVNNSAGYNVLKILLEDEQYLTGIRRTKMVLTFGDISDSSSNLIDDISSSSEQAINDLEKLANENPLIDFDVIQEDSLAKATLDSIRMTTAKEFLFDSENFEKNLLLSQLKVLRLISHLATQLEEIEPNVKRKLWLSELSSKYEGYYQRVNSLFTIQT